MSQPDTIFEELLSVRNYLAAAQDMLKSGYMPNLAELEQRVAAVCLGLQTAESGVQQRAKPELSELLKDLDACEQSIRDWKENRREP